MQYICHIGQNMWRGDVSIEDVMFMHETKLTQVNLIKQMQSIHQLFTIHRILKIYVYKCIISYWRELFFSFFFLYIQYFGTLNLRLFFFIHFYCDRLLCSLLLISFIHFFLTRNRDPRILDVFFIRFFQWHLSKKRRFAA